MIGGPSGAALTIGGGNLTSTVIFSGNSSNTYAGTTNLAYGTLVLSKTGAVAIPGNMVVAANPVQTYVTLTQPNQFASTSTITVNSTTNNWFRLSLNGNNQTLAGITDAGGAVVQNGPMNVTAPANAVLTLNLTTTNNNISGFVRNNDNGSNATTLGLNINGSGALTLSGANITYTGATNVNGGTLGLQDTTAFGSAINVGAAGMLKLVRTSAGFGSRSSIAGNNIGGSGVINVNNAANTAGNTDGGWATVSGGTLNFSGTINVNSGVFATDGQSTVTGTSTVNVAAGAVLATHDNKGWTIGPLNGAGDVTPAQSGGGTYSLTVGNGNGSGAFTGIIHGNNSSGGTDGSMEAGYLALTKTGAGTEVLTGNNTFTGQLTINGGVLSTNNIQNGGTASGLGAGTGAIWLLGGALQYTGTGGTYGTTNRGIQLGTSGGTIDASGTGPLVFSSGGGGQGGAGQTGAATLTLTGSNTGANTFGYVINNASGTTSLVKNGAGQWVLIAANTYSGGTTVNGGTLSIANGGSASSTAITVNANGTLNLTQTNQGFGSRSNIAGNAISGSGVINVNNAGSGIGGGWAIANASNAMNFSGTLNINSGVFGTDGSGGGGVIQGTATVNVASGGVFTNHASSGVTIGTLNGAGNVTPAQSGGGTYNLTVGNGGGSGTFTGIIHGNNSTGGTDGSMEAGYLSLTKTGGGTQFLSGSNTYTGATTISGGTLAIGGSGYLGSGNYSASIANSGAFVYNSSSSQTLSGNMTGNGSLTQAGPGQLTLSGANSYSGGTTINGGLLQIGTGSGNQGNTVLPSGAVTVASGATIGFSMNSESNRMLSNAFTLSGSGSSGQGALVFNNAGTSHTDIQIDNLTLAGNATIGLTGNNTTDVSGIHLGENSGSLNLAGYTLTIAGGGPNNNVSLWQDHLTGGGGIQLNPGAFFALGVSPAWAGTVTLNGGTFGVLSSNQTFTGPIVAAAGTTSYVGNTGNNGDLFLNGNISGSGNITTTGNSWSVYLGGNNSGFSGTWTSINEDTYFTSATAGGANAAWVASGRTIHGDVNGTVSLGALSGNGAVNAVNSTNTTFSVGALGTNTTFSGAIQNNSGSIAITKVGSGVLTLTSASDNYSGATNVNGGTLTLQDTTSFASAINVGAAGTLNIVRTSTGFASRSAIAGNAITGSGVINVNNAGSGINGGWVYATSPNAMNFSGTININSGVFTTDGQQGAGVIQGTATVNVASGGVFSNHSSNGVTIGALNGAGNVTPAQAGGGTYNLTVGNGGGSGTFTGIIHGNNSTGGSDGSMEAGYLSLTKTGSGIEVLSGVNTYTGNTTVNGGTLALTSAGRLGGGAYAGAISIATGAEMDFNGSNTLSGNITGAGTLANLSADLILSSTANSVSALRIGGGRVFVAQAGAELPARPRSGHPLGPAVSWTSPTLASAPSTTRLRSIVAAASPSAAAAP